LAGTKRNLKSANSKKQSFRLMKMINVSKRQIIKNIFLSEHPSERKNHDPC
jgi:hypothetical protein